MTLPIELHKAEDIKMYNLIYSKLMGYIWPYSKEKVYHIISSTYTNCLLKDSPDNEKSFQLSVISPYKNIHVMLAMCMVIIL